MEVILMFFSTSSLTLTLYDKAFDSLDKVNGWEATYFDFILCISYYSVLSSIWWYFTGIKFIVGLPTKSATNKLDCLL